jgi:DNA-directed RNA polymerase specialized sigma24 family protein
LSPPDEEAFRELLEPLSRELHVYAYRMLGGFQDAEDALQEARLKAWRSLPTYESQGAFRASSRSVLRLLYKPPRAGDVYVSC